MRARSAGLLFALLFAVGTASTNVTAQPKKASAARKGRAPARSATPAASAAAAAADDNPYGGNPEAPATTAAPPASSGEPRTDAAPLATTPVDAKLDEPPPPRTEKTEGPRPSPLTPVASEFQKGAPAPGPGELDRLMADIATLRARVAALTTSLFSSKLRVYVHTEGEDARITTFVVTLDDGVVFQGGPAFMADEQKVVYEHAVAPGSHVLGVEIERQDARGAAFRTWQATRFAIQVPEKKLLEANLDVEDDSDMAEDFPDDEDGKYELEVSLRAMVQD